MTRPWLWSGNRGEVLRGGGKPPGQRGVIGQRQPGIVAGPEPGDPIRHDPARLARQCQAECHAKALRRAVMGGDA